MKKITSFFLAIVALITMVSCGSKKGNTTEEIGRLSKPVITLTDNVVSWDSVKNAQGYIVKVNNEEKEEQIETTYTINGEGTFVVSVKAVSSDLTKWYSSGFSDEVTYTYTLSATTIWVVGDSTVCDYAKYDETTGEKTGVTDKSYFYDRYGYATQFTNFLSDKVTVKNLALSGRSARSLILDENKVKNLNLTKQEVLELDYNREDLYTDNYKKLVDEIKEGDYLVIGFGHNDEKFDDELRFSDASKSTDTLNSFKNILYEKYIKLAEENGATPILDTPIVRYTNTLDFTGSNGHVITLTADNIDKFGSNGTSFKSLSGHSVGDVLDYRQAILDLGEEKNVQTVDLTTLTASVYTAVGAEEAQYFHAMTSGNSQTEPNLASIDKTHINIYGAKEVAYLFVSEINSSNCTLKRYVDQTKLVEPTKSKDLVQNEYYTYVEYSPMNLDNWKETTINGYDTGTKTYDLTNVYTTITDGWYGTAFGDCGGDPYDSSNQGYFATETSAGVFKVGQSNSSSKCKGKIASGSEGYAFAFTRVSSSKNFTLSASGTIITQNSDGKQSGFGLMLRDDCYVPTNNAGILSNNICAGIWQEKSGVNNVGYARVSGTIERSGETSSLTPEVGTTIECTISRVGQVVTTTIVYDSKTYTNTYTDFDLVGNDFDYMYIGMYGARGIIAEWTNVNFQITGDSQGA